jgi:hypothetical protein
MKKGLFAFLFFASVVACAQDSLSVSPVDSTSAKMVIPSFYLDYGKLLTAPSNFETKYEGGIELIFNDRWQLITELGIAELTPRSAYENGQYRSEGSYYRIGLGYVPKREKDRTSRLGIGIRYGKSSFEDQGGYVIESTSELQPDIEVSFDRRNLSATWWEMVFYSDKEMNNWLTLGFQFRVRMMQDYDRFEDVDIYAIPGYGRAQDNSIPAVNLFIKITPF